MKSKLRAAIVGYGKMGKIREGCILNHPSLELVGLCDSSENTHTHSKVPVCTNYKELIQTKPDLVFICTPNAYSPEITCFFLNKKIHVFCEKPPGTCKEDIAEMIQAENLNSGTLLKFGFNHRYHDPVIEAKAMIDKGRFGRILWLRGVYGKSGAPGYENLWRNRKELSGGGILIDQGIHMLDLFRLFCGEFDEINSFIGTFYWPVQVEDNAFALLRNQAGQVAMLHSSATQWQHKFLLDIYLEKGYLSISGILSSTRTYGTESLKIARCIYDQEGYPQPNPEETVTYYDEDKSWEREVNEFVDCILKEKPIEVGFSLDAFRTMELVEKVYSADKKWKHAIKSINLEADKKYEKSSITR